MDSWPLRGAFDALRTETAQLETPPGLERQLMSAFARQHRPAPWHQGLAQRWTRLPWRAAGGALAIALAALVLVPRAEQPGAPAAPQVAQEGAFVAVASRERIEQEPSPRMVRADVPRSALAALGVAVAPEDAGEMVRAEMLVGADGNTLALRFVASE
ncbi:MAG: hypothetical protein V4582_03885 [Pseudomonadota bacterium]